MKEQKVINRKQLPTYLPVWQTLTVYLALDHFHAPQWLWGALTLFYLILWIAAITAMTTEKSVEINL